MLDFVINETAKLVPGLPIETIQVGTIYVSELSDHKLPPSAERSRSYAAFKVER